MSRRHTRIGLGALLAAAVLVAPTAAYADHADDPHTQNIHAMGHSPDFGNFDLPDGQRDANSDLAFWADLIFAGDYDGFRIIKNAPGNPKEIYRQHCNGDQGDIVVWENILVRSWNSPAPAGRTCDGQTVPTGFEGLHVFDISNLQDPVLVGSLALDCGSHTATGVPDLDNNRLIIYSNDSSGCTKGGVALGNAMDVVEVPLDDPGAISLLRQEPIVGGSLGSNNGCHDAGAILGDVNLLACASGHAANVFSIGAPRGGTLEDPLFLYNIEEADAFGNKVGVGGRWHSAAFTWDGEVLVLGWEPGGGGAAECTAEDPDIKKSLFFYDADDGTKLGQWVLPRDQGADENCTIHNYNIVPLRSGRYVAVSGNYQAGTWVTDFTDPANPETVAWSDPPSLGPGNFCGGQCKIGGAWSSYWYNNFIYENDITRGLRVYRVSDSRLAGAIRLDHMNPQTQEFSL